RIWCCPECPEYDERQWDDEEYWREDDEFERTGAGDKEADERCGDLAPRMGSDAGRMAADGAQ
ncbi:MAG: hypothetical protein IJO59_06155, partial [Clostridia bacterium]|nr:hypothetical protein [Clostridia bacterium]